MNGPEIPARAGPPRGADGLIVALSDIEMGEGGTFDDFPHDDWLSKLVAERTGDLPDDFSIDLVFNGDTWDFLKTSWRGGWPAHIDAEVALGKLGRISDAHPRFLESVRHFLAGGAPGRRRVAFIVGNHDPEILFPEVQAQIRASLGDHPGIRFPGASLRIGDVHLEHGQQLDPMFTMDLAHPFLQHEQRDILNVPWGTVALLAAAIPLRAAVFQYDRIKPRDEVLALVPELKELLLDAFWRYWTGDYLKALLAGSDPLTRLSWVLFKEVVYRFGSRDPDVTVSDRWTDALKASDELALVVLGHEHRASWWTWGGRKILRGGCLRDEYAVTREGQRITLLPKVWVEVWTRNDAALSSTLVEAFGPPPPPGHMPESLFEMLPAVRALLASVEDRAPGAAARAAQEARENAAAPASAGRSRP